MRLAPLSFRMKDEFQPAPIYKSWIYRLSPPVLLAAVQFGLIRLRHWLIRLLWTGNPDD